MEGPLLERKCNMYFATRRKEMIREDLQSDFEELTILEDELKRVDDEITEFLEEHDFYDPDFRVLLTRKEEIESGIWYLQECVDYLEDKLKGTCQRHDRKQFHNTTESLRNN
jgi:hypothetical protein